MERKTLYLDACCLNRLFDDQTQDRVRMETEAIMLILKRSQEKRIRLIGSEVLVLELQKTPNFSRRIKLLSLLQYVESFVKITPHTKLRADDFMALGMSAFDAFHVASAEKENVNCLLTTDDEMLKIYQQHKIIFRIEIQNPLVWIKESQLI